MPETVTFRGAGLRLDDYDLPRIGARIGVGEDELHALLDVESRGKGFDSQGRVIALFEPHVFYRELPPSLRDKAVAQGLAYAKWGAKPYPKDSYPRIEAAMLLDETAALRSASWGLGQIMGFNATLAGYDSPQAMVSAFAEDEAAQLEAMIQFIVTAKLDDNLRAHDWAGFALGYNGSGYAKHGYHTRLADRFRWWQGKPDTPWAPEMAGSACPCPTSP